MPPDYHRATIGDDISMGDYAFSPDSTQLALVSTPRDHSGATLRVADTATGVVRDVLSGIQQWMLSRFVCCPSRSP